MKKIFAAVLATFAITFSFALAEAADVPAFRQVIGQNLKFAGTDGDVRNYNRSYVYTCSVGVQEQFAEQFVAAMIKNYSFKLTGHFVNDYRKTSAELFETWVLTYTGSKKVTPFVIENYANMYSYKAHLVVRRFKRWSTGNTEFIVRLSNDLTYGDD